MEDIRTYRTNDEDEQQKWTTPDNERPEFCSRGEDDQAPFHIPRD